MISGGRGSQAAPAAAAPAAKGEDSFVFDLKNGFRVWLSEAVKRGEVKAEDAETSIRNIDPAKAIDFIEDYVKLLTGTVKDASGRSALQRNLLETSTNGGAFGSTSSRERKATLSL